MLLGGATAAQAALINNLVNEVPFNWSFGPDNTLGTADDINDQWGQVELLNGGNVALTSAHPRGADGGSLQLTAPVGAILAKAGAAYYPTPPVGTAVPAGSGFGQLKDLTTASYEWMAPAGQTSAPLMRLFLSNGPYNGLNHIATLAYIPSAEAGFATSTWTTANMLGGLQVQQTSNNAAGQAACGAQFSAATFTSYAGSATCGNLFVFAVEIGFGRSSFPNGFDGAADNVTVVGTVTTAAGPAVRISLSDQFGIQALSGGSGATSVPALGLGGLLGLGTMLAACGALYSRRKRAA